MKIFGDVNIGEGGKIINAVVNSGTSFPSNPDVGELFFRTDDDLLYVYDSIGWESAGEMGTVTSVSVTTANGVSGSVATATTTPAITLSLGAITPTSVAASGTVTGSNLSGTNTGNQTITLTGDVTGSGTGSFAATLATVNGNVGSFSKANITVNAKGLITAAANSVPVITTVTYSGTPTVDWAGADIARLTLTGNAVIAHSNGVDGQRLILEITQDGVGGRTVTFASDTRFGTDITSITLSTGAGKMDRIGFIYNATAAKYDVVAFVKGF